MLEAVCVLLRLQSPRTNSIADLTMFEKKEFGTQGQLDGVTLRHVQSGKRRRLTVDGEVARKPGDYLRSSGLVVWMGNEDLQLVRGSGENRRRYLDFAGSQLFPDYRTALRSYEKAVRSRNALLKRDATPNWNQIDAYTQVLVEHGTILIQRRRELVSG